jgi:hypothetical protein
MITAKEARENSEKVNLVENEMKILHELIEDNSKNGRRDAFRLSISKEVEERLISLGFGVERSKLSPTCKIYW